MNQKEIYPEFLCDYLRKGFGYEQINRLYTGSTGLIEIQPKDVNEIAIPSLPSINEQKKISDSLRRIESKTDKIIEETANKLSEAEKKFYNDTLFL